MPEQNTRSGYHLWFALISLVGGGFVLLAFVLWSAYQSVWSEARDVANSQSELVEARLDSTLRRVEATLDDLAARISGDAYRSAGREHFRQRIETDLERARHMFPEVAGFRVIDAHGDVLYRSGGGEYANLADRSYFTVPKSRPDIGIVFSEVITSRITGRPTIVAARAARGADGEFLGVISAAIELEHFESLFRSVRLGENSAISIRRSDEHTLVVRFPPVPGEINRPLNPAHPIVKHLQAGGRQGALEFAAQSDGVRRIYSFRVLEHYPFYVSAGLAEKDVMAAWQQQALLVLLLGSGLFVGMVAVVVALYRSQRREQAAAQALRLKDERLTSAQRIAQMGSWEVTLPGMRVRCSEELFRIFELPQGAEWSNYQDFLGRVHPEDRETVDRALQDSIASRQPATLKHRLLMPDGRIKFVLECCEAEYGADGKPLRVIGTSQDVTGQQEMMSKMLLLASAVQYSGEAILMTDAENRIVEVNPAFTRLTGYEAAEAMGRNPRFLSAGRTTREEYAQLWSSLAENDFWQGEIWDRRKDGAVYPKWMSISVIRDDDGGVRYYVAHFTDISSERAAEERLHHIAHHDVLTGLFNRFSLKGHLDQALAAARRDAAKVALLFIDLDRFKVINDTLGHHIGDLLLIEVARRLESCVRDSDVVARLGGDEFVIMLTGIAQSSAVATVAEKLVFNIGCSCHIEGFDLYTSPSIGIAIYPTDGPDGETLMKNADAAMYHAKMAGRNNFQFFDQKMNDAAVDRLKIENSLRQALANQEFRLHYQPVIDVVSGRVRGLEALVRWQHPEQGLLSPLRFIGVAEETGLIQPLGEWVIWEACRQLAEFKAGGLSDFRMAINISAVQMRNGNLPLLVRGVMEAYDLKPEELMFEITESVAMEQPTETVRILDLLSAMGVSIAIDDFGTGYSSLSYLHMFPISHLKLDRSFVEEIGNGTDGSVICDATIGLAHSLGLKVVAEGVETPAQLDYLQQLRCDMVQGYLFSRPLPANEVVDIIRQRNLQG
ncbi:EAL domain-containing protein [uncultured Dechloromonas sp.]|uniref:bifunctional diguanylate cyclase/phosphodiesterase n=1 Tax=uncultured Dechloromonas sp. TaxID=171719 RepID=UPI0025F4D35A|nr:EAL domain-containing protein [uncultured Dechloromonas sp.]